MQACVPCGMCPTALAAKGALWAWWRLSGSTRPIPMFFSAGYVKGSCRLARLVVLGTLACPQVIHLASCEVAPSCQRFILRNFRPAKLFPNIFSRTHAELRALKPVDVYSAGFPCKAPGPQWRHAISRSRATIAPHRTLSDHFLSHALRFSSLRHKTKLLRDKQARPFWKVVEAIKELASI